MKNQHQHLEEVLAFLREHRNNESHFEKIYARLEEECNNGYDRALQGFKEELLEIKEKGAGTYRQMKDISGTAYPEFEQFVSDFEKAVAAALKETNKAD